jgi:hypothetical protein
MHAESTAERNVPLETAQLTEICPFRHYISTYVCGNFSGASTVLHYTKHLRDVTYSGKKIKM